MYTQMDNSVMPDLKYISIFTLQTCNRIELAQFKKFNFMAAKKGRLLFSSQDLESERYQT